MIIALVGLAIIAWMFYYFLIKGNIFPLLLLGFGIFGGNYLLTRFIPSSASTIMTFMSYNVSYAAFIATVISIIGIGMIMETGSN